MNPNNYQNQKNRALKRKIEIILEKGGCCSKCGYNKNISALELHHIDPTLKTFQLDSRHLSNSSLMKIKKELDKCILLCSNCHREEHNPSLEFSKVIIVNQSERTINKPYKKPCKHCKKHFPSKKGKIFCSKNCRVQYKNYPTINEINDKYEELNSWEKVAIHFSLTRRIIQNIRKNNQML